MRRYTALQHRKTQLDEGKLATLNNDGPRPADGALVTDPAPTHLTRASATCAASGGAVCPATTGAALVAALQGAGIAVPVLPVGGSVTFTLSCSVP